MRILIQAIMELEKTFYLFSITGGLCLEACKNMKQ